MPGVKTIGRRQVADSRLLHRDVLGHRASCSCGAGSRTSGTSFWSDEAYSAYYYAGRGPRGIFFGDYVPNNHVLYNLLSWVTTGRARPVRGVVPDLERRARRGRGRADRVVGLEAARDRSRRPSLVVLATVSPVHLVLTPQARGYGLAMFARRRDAHRRGPGERHEATRDVVLFAVGALVGIWTLPVFAIAAIAQAGVLLWNQELRKRTLIACGAIAVLTSPWLRADARRHPAQRRPAVRRAASRSPSGHRRVPPPRRADDRERRAVRAALAAQRGRDVPRDHAC